MISGKRISSDDAIAHFRATGENPGTFTTPEAANAYATALHNPQASPRTGGQAARAAFRAVVPQARVIAAQGGQAAKG
jgi:hypothetical protein